MHACGPDKWEKGNYKKKRTFLNVYVKEEVSIGAQRVGACRWPT
jgi:hypothetical protein